MHACVLCRFGDVVLQRQEQADSEGSGVTARRVTSGGAAVDGTAGIQDSAGDWRS